MCFLELLSTFIYVKKIKCASLSWSASVPGEKHTHTVEALIDRENSFDSRICNVWLYFYLFFLHLELNDRGAWIAHNYIDRFEPLWKFDDNVERINENEVSCEEFIERFEKDYKPVVIEGSQVSWR